MDWGLLRSTALGTYGLRPKIIYPAKFYYFAIVTNCILRFWWVIMIFDIHLNEPENRIGMMTFFAMMAEALRRT
jgi:hypothetical protein